MNRYIHKKIKKIFSRYAFFVTIVLGAFIAGTGVVPGMLLLLRSVPPETRSPALGLQGLLVSGIGTLPSPVLWGLVIDSACRVWDYECQKRGACNVREKMSLECIIKNTPDLLQNVSIGCQIPEKQRAN